MSKKKNKISRDRTVGHKRLFSFCAKVGICAVILFVLLNFVAAVTIERTGTMAPVINEGQLLVALRFKTAAYDDVVLYRDPDGRTRIGRIIGQSNDLINIVDGTAVFVNGNIGGTRLPGATLAGDVLEYPLTVPMDSYFILNDQRDVLTDSRLYGCISADDIIGVLVFGMQYRGF